MKLIACTDCHAQYDITPMVPDSSFDCRCGASLVATAPAGHEARVQRCSACGAVAREDDERCDYCDSDIQRAPERGSLICPECMARNLEDARFCLACGVAFAPQAIVADVPELRCPCCEAWMAPCEVGGLVVQDCPKCHGLWAPENVFDALVDRATTLAREKAAQGEAAAPRVDGGNPARHKVEYRRCPACDVLMGRRNYRKRSGVIIDQCHEHGTWLDAHELERIAGWVLSGKAARAEQASIRLREEREQLAARAATQRVERSTIEFGSPGRSVFGGRRETSGVGTILDLLVSLLD